MTIQHRAYDLDLDYRDARPQTPPGVYESLPATPVTPQRASGQSASQIDQVDSSPLMFRFSPEEETFTGSASPKSAAPDLLRAMLQPSLDAIGLAHRSLVDGLAMPQSPPPATHASASHAIEVKQAPRVQSLQAALEELVVSHASDASLPMDCELAHSDACDAGAALLATQGAAKRTRPHEAHPDADAPETKRIRQSPP